MNHRRKNKSSPHPRPQSNGQPARMITQVETEVERENLSGRSSSLAWIEHLSHRTSSKQNQKSKINAKVLCVQEFKQVPPQLMQ